MNDTVVFVQLSKCILINHLVLYKAVQNYILRKNIHNFASFGYIRFVVFFIILGLKKYGFTHVLLYNFTNIIKRIPYGDHIPDIVMILSYSSEFNRNKRYIMKVFLVCY